MKTRFTRKQIKDSNKLVIALGYCDATYLLSSLEVKGYTAGIYGWDCDVLQYNYNIAITTGYRPIGHRPSYDLVKEYEEKAIEVYRRYSKENDIDTRLLYLLDEFINKVIEELN